MNDQFYQILAYALLLVLFYVFINFLSNGFFSTFIRVKASRGSKVLVEVHAVTDIYYTIGQFSGEQLKYKNRDKEKKSIKVSKLQVQKKIGVFSVSVDDEKNGVLNPNFDAVEGFDAVKVDHLIDRAMNAPAVDDQRIRFILLGIIACALLCLFIGYYVYNMDIKINLLLSKLNTV